MDNQGQHPAPEGQILDDQHQNEDLPQKCDDTIAEKNELRRRTTNDNLSSGQSIYPERPEVFIHGPGGDKRAINDGDYFKSSGHIGRKLGPSSEADDTIAEKNELRRRTTNDSLSSGQSVYLGRPELFVQEPGGDKGAIIQGDYGKFSGHIGRRFGPSSEAGESEGRSSVTSISDLGFDAAPEPAPDGFATLGLNQVSEADIEKSILKSIEVNLQMSKMDCQQYLPLDKFEAIFSSQVVELLMNANASKLVGDPQQRHRQIMGFKTKSFRRILATLVMVQQVSYIEDFIDEGIGDAEVPIRRSDDGVTQGFTCRNDTKVVQFLQRWSRSSAELFFLYQRMFFVPFFDIRENQLCSYEFGAEIRLPWQEYEAKTSGGHGLIHKVQINPNHFRFRSPSANVQPSRAHRSIGGDETDQKPLYFALKEIFTLDREAHRQELHALEKSFGQKQSERHLIKLLLTFQHGERCYLLFEWADGNLEEFWDSHKVDGLSDFWALKQCLGIATALKRIHGTATWQEEERKRLALEPGGKPQREWGRHGDIKPRNILWFKSHGDEHHHLVISDLGLTQFHSELTRSAVPVSRIGGFTEAYRPPEMDLGRNISQSYDIWSLGCVLLEFCLWYVLDADAIRKFEDGRLEEDQSDIPGLAEGKFFNIIENSDDRKALLKPVVGNTIQELRESEKCTPLITEILRLLQDSMLQIEPKDRSTISEICRDFQDVKASMKKDAGLPPQKVEAHISPSSLTVDTEVIDGGVNDSPQLDVPQRDVDLYYVHGGPGSSILDSAQIHPRHRALSIESGESDRIESAESEGESYDAITETNVNTATDRSVHPPEFPPELARDSAEARRQRRSAAVIKDNGQEEERLLPRMTSTATQTDFPTPGDSILYASSSRTTAPDMEAVQRESSPTKSQHGVPPQTHNDERSPLPQRRSSSRPSSGHSDRENHREYVPTYLNPKKLFDCCIIL